MPPTSFYEGLDTECNSPPTPPASLPLSSYKLVSCQPDCAVPLSRPLPSGRTAPAFLLIASATVVPSTAGVGGFATASAENASRATEVSFGSSGANGCCSGGAEGSVARRDYSRRGCLALCDGDPLLFYEATHGKEGPRKTGGRRSRSSGAASRVRGRVPTVAPALVVRGPSRAATIGGGLLTGRVAATFPSSRAGLGLGGVGLKRYLSTHGGWGTRIGFLEKRIIGGVTPSRCAGRNARPNKNPSPGSNSQARSVPGANGDPAGMRSGEEVRRRSSGNPSERSSVEQSAPASLAYSALCPALDGDGSLSFAPSTPVPITPKMLPPASLPVSSMTEIPRSFVENASPEVSTDGGQQRARGSLMGGNSSDNEESSEILGLRGVSTAPQPGTTGGVFGSERNDLGTFGVSVEVGFGVEVDSGETVRTARARPTTFPSSAAESVTIVADEDAASAGVAETPSLYPSGRGGTKGDMTSSVDVTGRNERKSRRKSRGSRVAESGSGSSLRGILIDAVKTGRGGAALRALRLMVSVLLFFRFVGLFLFF